MDFRSFLIALVYFVAAVLLIVGIKRMSSPRTARGSILWAGWGVLLATLVTFFWPGLSPDNVILIVAAIAVGGSLAWYAGRRVAMTDMPQMIALCSGMGGGAAAAIAAIELMEAGRHGLTVTLLAMLGGLVGSVSFSGSLLGFAKLRGWAGRPVRFKARNQASAAVLLMAAVFGLMLMGDYPSHTTMTLIFFGLALAGGIMMSLPVASADVPVAVSFYTALTGLAVALEGFVLGNEAMIIAGTVVAAAGALLTHRMGGAVHRPLDRVLFGGPADAAADGSAGAGDFPEIAAGDAGNLLASARRVAIVPGYGMAAARAQHEVLELARLLRKRGIKVRFAIHPAAGRIPSHMSLLLAEAGAAYEHTGEPEDVNPEFDTTDVCLVVGANDVVNPAARTDTSSPLYGMPILNADRSRNVIVIKRGRGRGFSGTENPLFLLDNVRVLSGEGDVAVTELIRAVEAI
ncbi:MAG: NAD(P)(+) transhydrogenase (Re/Si-specific) subunit beta [Gammaproteobacteria bacterium]